MRHASEIKNNQQIALWLIFCATVILGMILLGGVTRLTHSGLSMVEWKPLMGIIPPLSETDWQATFAKYQQFPEYQQVNVAMDLEGFKSIFLFEYAHRVLGRLIGVIFLVPFLIFWWRRQITPALTPKLITLFLLGGLQGLLGWYMVKSGLVDVPQVSQYRLTAHLGLAVIIYSYMLWVALDLLYTKTAVPVSVSVGLRRTAFSVSGLLFLMILSGGLVAGTRAGFAYNTFPLMGDSFFPMGLYGTEPVWRAAFEDITTVQFNHRMFAYLLCVLIGTFVWRGLKNRALQGRVRKGFWLLGLALVIQVSLGISTLLLLVPVSLAAAHQLGAMVLLTCSLYVSHSLNAVAESVPATRVGGAASA